MENNKDKQDFEQFVKQNADQYRMFPSEKVWKGIHSTLHTRKLWYNLGLGLLLLTTGAAVTWVMLSSSSKSEKINIGHPPVTPQTEFVASENKIDQPDFMKSGSILAKTNVPVVAIPEAKPNNTISLRNITGRLINQEVEIPAIAAEQNNQDIKWISPVAPTIHTESFVDKPIFVQVSDQLTDNDVDEFLRIKRSSITETRVTEYVASNPLTIESVLNAFKSRRKSLTMKVYFVPTISYRKLTENTSVVRRSQSNPYSYAALNDINSAVTHKPDMGLEFGFSAGYPVNHKVSIIGGLQINVSKYDIKAFTHPNELATIALSNGRPGSSSSSLSTISNYRNFDGYRSNWLHNLYISVSAPIGAEVNVTGNNRTYLGLSGTIQPTYILRDRAYLISTDYKNYAKVPSLIRKWNVSTSFEAFAGYSTGKIKWKVGPQVRYQMLSSFEDKYPVREHLFDFGLKIGVMLNK